MYLRVIATAMESFSTSVTLVCHRLPLHTAMYHSTLKNPGSDRDMMETSETQSPGSYKATSVRSVLKSIWFYMCEALRKVIHRCMSVPELLNIKEAWSDIGVSEMSLENRELRESFLNNSDPYKTRYISCLTEDKVMASDSDYEEEEEDLVPPSPQETDETEWSEEEDEGDVCEMSAENRELWESFNSDPYNPLCFSCPTGVKTKAPEIQQKHASSNITAREAEELGLKQGTKKRTKKVHFSEEVTIHNLTAWDAESRAARDGSCWMEMARDGERFRRRVENVGAVISFCLSAPHRAKILERLLNQSDRVEVVR